MTSRIARHSLFNLAGSLLPMALVLLTVPLYLRQIGEARYGVLALVWLWIGYFSIVDLGLSRATTHQMASLSSGSSEDRQSLFWTAMLVNGSLGTAGGLALWGAGSFIVGRMFEIPEDLRAEVRTAVPWIAAAVPLSTLGGVLNGTLEARGRFLALNLIQVSGSTLFQVLPLVVALKHGPDLAWLIPAAILSRTIAFVPLLLVAFRAVPVTWNIEPSRRWLPGLVGYGGWITATNILGTLVTSLDQVLIGSVIGVREVAWYSVPYSLLWRLMVFPTALVRTLFPAFTKVTQEESLRMASRSTRLVGAGFLPMVVTAGILIRPFLMVWVGPDFAVKAAPVGLILLPGIWLSAVASIPLSAIQARGRPSTVVKILLVETLPFLGVLWLGLHLFGIEGAAWAWTLRNLVYAVTFAWLCPIDRALILELWPAPLAIGIVCSLAALVPINSAAYTVGGLALLGGVASWSLWREPRLREIAASWPRRAGSSARVVTDQGRVDDQ